MPAAPSASPIHPVILSGGSGTRLWPASRALEPKQLLPLAGPRSLLQETALRVAPSAGPGSRSGASFAAPIVVCHEAHRFLVAEQLRAVGVAPAAVLLEPEGRNTAPAAAAAAHYLLASEVESEGGEADRGVPDGPGPLLLVLPSDHVIGDPAGFRTLVEAARPAALGGALVTFGIAPDRPETGYGYIRPGAALERAEGAFRVERFLEKPDEKTAARLLAEGGWLWNAGIFLLPARAFLAELAAHAPGIAPAAARAVSQGRRDLDFFRLDPEAFRAAPNRSIDHAVMEKTDRAAVVPAALAWSDAGSWAALWEIGAKDAAGNVLLGDAIAQGARNCYLRAETRLVAALGTQDLVVVETADAVLVAPRERTQEVKALVERLAAAGREAVAAHRRVRRPWGSYESLEAGPGFQVKRLSVKPGARLSLQAHAHRAEHWVVVRGRARVTRDSEVFELAENQSTFIPLGARHRLENPGAEPLEVIEVQSGDYLGEDDIVRFDDAYGRGPAEG